LRPERQVQKNKKKKISTVHQLLPSKPLLSFHS